jgi:hypothetical protein
MGVLDDAIREHLDLKRRHGAPEEELRRQEEEALGPARREVAPPSEEGEASGDGDERSDTADAVREGPPEDAPEPDIAPIDVEARPEEPQPGSGAVDLEPTDDEAPPRRRDSGEPLLELEDPHEPEVTSEPERGPFDFDADPEVDRPPEGSRRFDRESRLDDDPSVVDEAEVDLDQEPEHAGDALEDTPDFLEETPEHDRLWFEQKPPRDFDFD